MVSPSHKFDSNLNSTAWLPQADRFFNALPIPVVIVAQHNRRAVAANPKFLDLVARTASEVQGQPFEALFDWIDPLARQKLNALLAHEGPNLDVTAPLRLHNGEECIIQFSFEAIQRGNEQHFMVCCRDLTDQLLAEAAFEESHRVLTLLMDNLPGLVYRCVRKREGWILRFVSDGFEQLTGHSSQAWIGRPLADLFAVLRHPEDVHADHCLTDLTTQQNTIDKVYRIVTPDGEERWVWEQGRLVETVPGAPDVLEGFIANITHTKQAEAEARRKNELVNLLKHVAMFANDAATIEEAFQEALEVVCTFMDWSLGHVWFRHQNGADRLVPSALWSGKQQDMYASFRRYTMQMQLKPDECLVGAALQARHPRWVADVMQDAAFCRAEGVGTVPLKTGLFVPVLVANRVVAVMEFFSTAPVASDALLIDAMKNIGIQLGRVLERKEAEVALRESEQRWRSLVEDQPEVVVIVVKGIFVYANKAALKLFGATSLDEIVGQPFTRFSDPAFHERLKQRIRAVERGEKTEPFEHRLLRLDGEVRTIETFSVPITHENQPGTYTLVRDVTERKQAQEVLQRSYDELTRLTERLHTVREEERTHIAREIHDHLGHSLAVLKLDLEWLTSQKLDPSVLDRIKQARAQLIETIQDVRRIATDLRPALLDNFGLSVTLEWQASKFESHTGIACSFAKPTIDVQPDEERDTHIFRIFQEILTNVARHANAQNVWVSFTKEAEHLVLVVKDDGRGIAASALDGINSLGLVGMRERARQLGGTIDIHGQPGEGTHVTLRVPYSDS